MRAPVVFAILWYECAHMCAHVCAYMCGCAQIGWLIVCAHVYMRARVVF